MKDISDLRSYIKDFKKYEFSSNDIGEFLELR